MQIFAKYSVVMKKLLSLVVIMVCCVVSALAYEGPMPVYNNGGEDGLQRDIYANLNLAGMDKNASGRMVVLFLIDENGHVDPRHIKIEFNRLPSAFERPVTEAVKKLGDFTVPDKSHWKSMGCKSSDSLWFAVPVTLPVPARFLSK